MKTSSGVAALRTRTPGVTASAGVRVLLAGAGSLAVLALVVIALGANPAVALRAIIVGALGSTFSLGQTLMIATVLSLTGLAAAVPFSARLWNVGGEGQMYIGALVAAGVGVSLPAALPGWVAAPVVTVLAALGGACWGWVPGVLKARFDASEIVVSLMLNFVAILLATYAITDVWPQGFAPQTAYIAESAALPRIWPGTLVDVGVVLALGAVVAAWVLMARTSTGFAIRALGANDRAARLAGVRTGRVVVTAFVVAGAFGGLAGAVVVQGMNRALVTGFSGNYGFLGIAVALLARLNPLLILPAAAFLAVMRVGSNSLQAATGLSPSVGEVLVATLVVLLMVSGVIRFQYPGADR